MKDPRLIIGSDHGQWIAFRLTDKGYELSKDEKELRIAVADLIGEISNEVSHSVLSLLEECKQRNINEIYRADFFRTLEEIAICFNDGCYIASIGLCGKILEVCLKEVLLRHQIQFDSNAIGGTLIKQIKEKVSSEYIDLSLNNIASIINQSRITAVHSKESIPIPSRDQAIMVIYAMRDVVRRNLAHL